MNLVDSSDRCAQQNEFPSKTFNLESIWDDSFSSNIVENSTFTTIYYFFLMGIKN